ncbi:MAG: hypothetical protein CVU56_03460 [Deltaproteobacteria bacterium HGW-Deltaproteobacteria-14]|nr:MAG: hypothetical protein CVU56_03460 [Deltaproteobacteria bacterium HGW-Deltaproteobacteria-14]
MGGCAQLETDGVAGDVGDDADTVVADAEVVGQDTAVAVDTGAGGDTEDTSGGPWPTLCSACHGGPDNPAPPLDLTGGSDPSLPGVGAHQSHLGASSWHTEVACSACHRVPSAVGDAGHIDSAPPAEVDWGVQAVLDGAAPRWDGATCSNTYCHGGTLPGGGATPAWVDVNLDAAGCGTCHGVPPAAPHPPRTDCASCHPTITPSWDFAEPTRHIDGAVDVSPLTCSTCHGEGGEPAPPRDLHGDDATTSVGVGAHRSHLGPSTWHAEVACSACHLVPSAVDAVGHADTPLPAELVWSDLAAHDGASPSWDGAACSNTYCHGSTLPGGGAAPVWTRVGMGEAACGSCHGLPPAPPHTQRGDCATCHPTVDAALSFVNPSRHIDGTVDVRQGGCVACHGSGDLAAPPLDLTGHTETTARGVGAHRSHLGTSTWRSEIACQACHEVPTALGDPGHIDTPAPAELTWGEQALLHGAAPHWDGAACSNTYCHGGTLPGGGAAPTWTLVGQGEAACGTCHGSPPAAPHPQSSACSTCHATIAADGSFPDPTRHIDGVVDVITTTGCVGCHGSGDDPAPPVDLAGHDATTARGVGAHQSHLGTSSWHAQVGCASCHAVPATVDAPGHIDGAAPAELTWGGVARQDGAAPQWNGATCSNVYCHGGTLEEGGATVTWTSVGTGQAACGTCHGDPPAAPHPQLASCALCHPTIAANGTFPDPSRHIDGLVDVITTTCTSCHGGGTDPAPPTSVSGGSATTLRGVGAHQSHLGSSTWHAEITCLACHEVPATVDAVGHLDTALPAELTWGSAARAGGATPQWNGVACSNVYCHGTTLIDGGVAPTWTLVGTGQAACGTCHGRPPAAPHPQSDDCSQCHGEVVAADDVTLLNPSKHIDGIVQAQSTHPAGWADPAVHGAAFNNAGGPAACAACHGATLAGGTGPSCAGCHASSSANWQTDCLFCHGGTDNTTSAPPEGVDGEVNFTAMGVGAHTSHVETTTMHLAWGCATCHGTPPVSVWTPGHIDGDGAAEVVFDTLNGSATWDAAAGSCSNLYCHGNGRAAAGTASWPTSPPTLSCHACHQDWTNVTSSGMSGEHRKHNNEGIGCNRCHADTVNSNHQITGLAKHVNGLKDVKFSGSGSWNPAGDGTCSSVGCHGSESWR